MSVLAGVVLGFLFYLVQGSPTLDPGVIAQVLVVSVAEVVVCWSVIGSVRESLPRQRGRWIPPIVALQSAGTLARFERPAPPAAVALLIVAHALLASPNTTGPEVGPGGG